MCLDANKLHGHSMMHFFPIEILHQFNPEKSKLDNYCNDDPIGSFLEIDLDYPDKLHGLKNDYPLSHEENKSYKRNFF